MISQQRALCLWVALAGFQIGCSGDSNPEPKETIPVTGEVTVDAAAAEGIKVALHDLNATNPQSAVYSLGHTDGNGKFAITTYSMNDGAPEGEYAVAFSWVEGGVLTGKEGKDKLGGKYVMAAKSIHKIKVAKGQPVDMGKIELKTK